MKTIWKFPMNHGMVLSIDYKATPIHFGNDPEGTTCVWLEHDTSKDTETARKRTLSLFDQCEAAISAHH